jgi:hypothetical protein
MISNSFQVFTMWLLAKWFNKHWSFETELIKKRDSRKPTVENCIDGEIACVLPSG